MPAVRIVRGSRGLFGGTWSKLSSSSATSSSARWFGIAAQPVPKDEAEEEKEDLILSDVRIFGLVAKLGRELFVAAVDVADMAGKNRIIIALIYREREAEHFP